jgi:hypothetical protein
VIAVAVAVAVCLPAAPMARASDSPAAVGQFAQLQAELRRAHRSGDSAAYLAASRVLYSFLNGSPRATLQLMSAETVAGRQDQALQHFAEYVAMGQADEAALQAKSFDAVRTAPRYRALYAAMAENSRSVSAASAVIRLDGVRVPEDIDFDPLTQSFFITTMLGQSILQVDMAGHAKLFAAAPDHWPMMALKIDPQRRMIWATEVAVDGFASARKADWGRSAVLQYDLRNGALRQRIEGPSKAALGDMTLDSNGNAIVSDGELGGIYRIGRDRRRFERIDAGDFISPQTPALLPDGRHLLVPDYVRGIGVLDLDSKAVRWFAAQGGHAMSGIDGLYAAGSSLIATQNGASPERVVRFVLNESKTGVVSESIVERSTPTLGDPTHGVLVGNDFYYIANAGWNLLDEHGNVLPGKELPTALIMRLKLPAAASASKSASRKADG